MNRHRLADVRVEERNGSVCFPVRTVANAPESPILLGWDERKLLVVKDVTGASLG